MQNLIEFKYSTLKQAAEAVVACCEDTLNGGVKDDIAIVSECVDGVAVVAEKTHQLKQALRQLLEAHHDVIRATQVAAFLRKNVQPHQHKWRKIEAKCFSNPAS